MYFQTVEKAEVNKCLLCHDAPCAKACPALDPARVLRSLRFQNETGAAMNLPKEDTCANCATPCTQACPAQVPIPGILSCLRAESPVIGPDTNPRIPKHSAS